MRYSLRNRVQGPTNRRRVPLIVRRPRRPQNHDQHGSNVQPQSEPGGL